MKKSGSVILAIGLLFTVFTTFSLIRLERITTPSRMETAQVKIHHQIWKPLVGAIVVMIGAGIYVMGKSREVKAA